MISGARGFYLYSCMELFFFSSENQMIASVCSVKLLLSSAFFSQ